MNPRKKVFLFIMLWIGVVLPTHILSWMNNISLSPKDRNDGSLNGYEKNIILTLALVLVPLQFCIIYNARKAKMKKTKYFFSIITVVWLCGVILSLFFMF